jgi:hypothetical protein
MDSSEDDRSDFRLKTSENVKGWLPAIIYNHSSDQLLIRDRMSRAFKDLASPAVTLQLNKKEGE